MIICGHGTRRVCISSCLKNASGNNFIFTVLSHGSQSISFMANNERICKDTHKRDLCIMSGGPEIGMQIIQTEPICSSKKQTLNNANFDL